MKQRLIRVIRVAGGWALPISGVQLTALGVGEADTAVLVTIEDGDPPQLVIRRAPTFDEAMAGTLTDHAEALRTLATVPENLGATRMV